MYDDNFYVTQDEVRGGVLVCDNRDRHYVLSTTDAKLVSVDWEYEPVAVWIDPDGVVHLVRLSSSGVNQE